MIIFLDSYIEGKYKHLRDTFAKIQKKMMLNDLVYQNLTTHSKSIYDNLSFLSKHIRHRQDFQNIIKIVLKIMRVIVP